MYLQANIYGPSVRRHLYCTAVAKWQGKPRLLLQLTQGRGEGAFEQTKGRSDRVFPFGMGAGEQARGRGAVRRPQRTVRVPPEAPALAMARGAALGATHAAGQGWRAASSTSSP